MNAKEGISLLVIIFFVSACSIIPKGDGGFDYSEDFSDAAPLLAILKQRNEKIRSFKGIGKIKLWNFEGSQISRLAWLGSIDGRLRVEILGISGQPIAKLIVDGEKYFLLSPIDQQLYQETCADPDLKNLTGISIKASEIIKFLGGGLPLYTHDTLSLNHIDSGNGYVLTLKKRWRWVVEKIYFDESLSSVKKVELYNWRGLQYRAILEKPRNVNGHFIPFKLTIANDSSDGFSIDIDRCWTDIVVLPEMFLIDPIYGY